MSVQVKPIVKHTFGSDLNTYVLLLDGTKTYVNDGEDDRPFFDLVVDDSIAFETLTTSILNLRNLSGGERQDFLWLVTYTQHNYTITDLISVINEKITTLPEVISKNRTFFDTTFRGLESRLLYYIVFNNNYTDGYMNKTLYNKLALKDPRITLYMYRSYEGYGVDRVETGGPIQYLTVKNSLGIRNVANTEVDNLPLVKEMLGIGEPDMDVSLQVVMSTIVEMDKQGAWDPNKVYINRDNYLQFENREIAQHFGINRKDYHVFMRDKDLYEEVIDALPQGERFSMWEVLYTPGDTKSYKPEGKNCSSISYGRTGEFENINLDEVARSFDPSFKTNSMLDDRKLRELYKFLSDPKHVRDCLRVDDVLDKLRKYIEVNDDDSEIIVTTKPLKRTAPQTQAVQQQAVQQVPQVQRQPVQEVQPQVPQVPQAVQQQAVQRQPVQQQVPQVPQAVQQQVPQAVQRQPVQPVQPQVPQVQDVQRQPVQPQVQRQPTQVIQPVQPQAVQSPQVQPQVVQQVAIPQVRLPDELRRTVDGFKQGYALLPQNEQFDVSCFLLWAYTYLNIAKGLNSKGLYTRDDIRVRLADEIEIFKTIDNKLSPRAKELLKRLPIINERYMTEVLPIQDNDLYSLAANHSICATFKGLNMRPMARLMITELGSDPVVSARDWVRDMLYKKPNSTLYPINANVDFEAVR